jgi:hypothetical protein
LAIKHNLYKIIRDIDMRAEFEILEVKVLIIFFGTPVFFGTQGWTLGLKIERRVAVTQAWTLVCRSRSIPT